MRSTSALIFLVSLCIWCSGPAGAQSRPWDEYRKKISDRSTFTPLDDQLFMENIDLYNGRLSFRHVDLEVPGNSILGVQVARSLTAEPSVSPGLLMGDWSLDVPYVGGVYAAKVDGVPSAAYNWPGQRCSGSRTPPLVAAEFWPVDYWHGISANMPNGGELLEPAQGIQTPTTGGPYRWVTANNTWFECLSSVSNGTGEGFIAHSPDGTKYWFNWLSMTPEEMIERYVPTGDPGQIAALNLERNRVLLHATRVEDKFGNWVTYTYSNTATSPPRLDRIESSDNRVVTFSYNGSGLISSMSSAGRTWTYTYSGGHLTRVDQPDGTSWQYSLAQLRPFSPGNGNLPEATCSRPGLNLWPEGSDSAVGTMTHPSGAVGEFTVAARLHGRSHVPKNCLSTGEGVLGDPEVGTYSDFVRMYWVSSLVKKKIQGPGNQTWQWDLVYNNSGKLSDYPVSTPALAGPGSWSSTPYGGNPNPSCVSDACAATVSTEVTGPNDWTKYTYGNSYRYNEHKLLKVEQGGGPQNILRTEVFTYELATTGLPFAARLGVSTQYKGDSFTDAYLRPQKSRTTIQDGVAFTYLVNTFDAFGRPTSVTKGRSPAP